MGKRQRRRKRRQTGNSKPNQQVLKQRPIAVPEPVVAHFPAAGPPLLEVTVAAGTPEDVRALCLDYWEFTEPGTWVRNVSTIGPTSVVYGTVKQACTAYLLTVQCPACAGPVTVTSRSEVAATGFWKAGAMPEEPMTAPGPCVDCERAQRAIRAQQAAAEKAKLEERRERRRANAGAWLAEHRDHACRQEMPSLTGTLVLLAMADIMEKGCADSVGPPDEISYTFTGSRDRDIDVLRELYAGYWIAPTPPVTIDDFAYNDDDTVSGVYLEPVPWRLAHWAGDNTPDACHDVRTILRHELHASEDADAIQESVYDIEAGMVVQYLAGLLKHKYGEAPIPESRLPEAHDTARAALKDGFTLRQMLAVAWSATSRSVAWGARTQWVKPGTVASATVTNLGKGVGYAKDRGVPEYDLPHWLKEPAILAPARRILAERAGASQALAAFRDIHQRVTALAEGPVEFQDELDDGGGFKEVGPQVLEWLTNLREGRAEEDDSPVLTYALVTPDGEMQMKTATTARMRNEVSSAGAGVVDRIVLDSTTTVNAYIGELVPATAEHENRAAHGMLRLLGDQGDKLYGPVAFFQVSPRSNRPGSLDDDHQELIRAAHRAVATRMIAA